MTQSNLPDSGAYTLTDLPNESLTTIASAPGYYHLASSDLGLVAHFLGEAAPLLSIDLHTVREADLPREIAFTRTVVNPGRMDGYAVFFRARVDGDLSLCTSPLDPQRAPHWGFRILRTGGDHFAAGDQIETRLTVGRWSDRDTWCWSHVKRANVPAARH